jgi:glycosyltransferase involved in cell wall biosynthesis
MIQQPKSIVLVTQVFHPDTQATSQLLSELFVSMAGSYPDRTVLSAFPAGGAGQLQPSAEDWRGICIRRGGLRINVKSRLSFRLAGYLTYSWWLGWRLLFFTPSEARVVVVTNPPFAPIVVYLCSLFRSLRYDIIIHDIYPDGLVAVGAMSGTSVLANLWGLLNRCAFSRARSLVVLGRDMASLLSERYGVRPSKIFYISNWAVQAHAAPLPAEETRLWKELGLTNEFVVQYSGNMGLWHDIDNIINAAYLLRTKPIIFLMIGGGMRRTAAELLAKKLELGNVIWVPFRSKNDLADSLACCHLAIVSQRMGLEGVAVPSKIYGILASARPVLAQVPARSEVALLVGEDRCGVLVEPENIEEMARVILELSGDRNRTKDLGAQGYKSWAAKYRLELARDRYVSALEKDLVSESACEVI